MVHPGVKEWNPAWGRGLRKIKADPERRGGTRTGQGRDKKGRRRGTEESGRGPSGAPLPRKAEAEPGEDWDWAPPTHSFGRRVAQRSRTGPIGR